MKTGTNRAIKGFTLIEVILTILLSALALGAILPLIGPVFLRSHEGPALLQDALDLHTAMENLASQQETDTLLQIQTAVGNEGDLYQGRFAVIHNRFVTFTGHSEGGTPTTNNLLRVTLGSNVTGEELTRHFVEEP